MKPTVIIGATDNTTRYAYLAAQILLQKGHPIYPIGIRHGKVFDHAILVLEDKPKLEHIHTVTMYVNPNHQTAWIDYIISLKPKRVIFNPGTENIEFENQLENVGIEVEEACTLVLLKTNQF